MKIWGLRNSPGKQILINDGARLIAAHGRHFFLDITSQKQRVFRGINHNTPCYMIDSKNFVRKSANTHNFYTLIIDEILRDQWSTFPLRSRGVICTTSERYARYYGNTYVVYPYDTSLVGVSPARDIWVSFKKTIPSDNDTGLHDFNLQLIKLANELSITKLNDTIQDIELLRDAILLNKHLVRQSLIPIASTIVKSDFDLYKAFRYMFDPVVNNVRSTVAQDGITSMLTSSFDGQEIWFQGKCVLVDSAFIGPFEEKVKQLIGESS
jgi:hypothetical protein